MLKLTNLHKTFNAGTVNEKKALNGLNFQLDRGDFATIVGSNGAGKSTTLKCLEGSVHPDAGSVTYFGQPFASHEEQAKRLIGFELGGADFYRNKRMSTIAAVTRRFYDNWDQGAFENYCRLFSVDQAKRVKELSQGMRVKFAVALALSHRSKLLVLDEPTSGLDGYNMRLTVQLFKQLAKEGKCLLLITHDMDLIAEAADCVLYLEQGKVRYHRNVLRQV